MKRFEITVKERGVSGLLHPTYIGDVTREFVIDFFGLNKSEVEWYKIEEFIECCICGTEISSRESHDPYPVSETGRCCAKCNYTIVLPKRMSL